MAPSFRTAPTFVRYHVLGWLCLAASIAYAGRSCLGVASDEVQKDLEIEVLRMSAVMSAFFWGYALFQIPSGWLAQRWGVRRSLSLYATAWSVACLLVGLSSGFWTVMMAQLLFGVAQAGIFPASAAAIARWLPLTRRALASGALGSFMSVGGACGVALTGLLLSDLSWRGVFALFALPGFFWAGGFWRVFRERPQEHPGVNDAEQQLITNDHPPPRRSPHAPVPWLSIAKSFDLWMICGQQFFRAAGYVFYTTWFPKYLRKTYGVTTEESGYLAMLPLLAVVCGGLLGGWLVDWIWRRTGSRRLSRQAVAVAAMLGCALLISLAFFVTTATSATLLIAGGSFSAALGGSSGYTVTIDKAGQFVAPVFGIMNMSGNIGAALSPLAVALLVRLSHENWSPVLWLFVGIYLAAAFCWALVNPTGTIDDQPFLEAQKAVGES